MDSTGPCKRLSEIPEYYETSSLGGKGPEKVLPTPNIGSTI
jgi:hypothetical protein